MLRDGFGIDGVVLSWIESYLNGRQHWVKFGSAQSLPTLCDCGVPQGSVLSSRQLRGSVDIPGMSTYLVLAGNCIFRFSTVRTICLCRILNKNVKIKTPLSFNNQVSCWIFRTFVLISRYKPHNLTYIVSCCFMGCSAATNWEE